MACGERISDSVNRYTNKIISNWDYIDKSILIFLFEKERVTHCYAVSSLLAYVEREDKVHSRCEALRDVGLLNIYGVKETFVNAILYELTDFGKEVTRKLLKHEEENGYPTTKEFIDKNLQSLKMIDGGEDIIFSLEGILSNLPTAKA